ncbi:MAG: hypothetical protein A2Z34_06660 [Planctomycetes bacterium RBG_16_59_8]|nr:MAG: hypothetical protein A2Z34_06660 [Planctomycetes bacterium RBG_16_59_8]
MRGKRVVLVVAFAMALGLIAGGGCGGSMCGGHQHSASPATSAPAKSYTCPMHPDVARDKPGDCPICGMTLVEKKDVGSGHKH